MTRQAESRNTSDIESDIHEVRRRLDQTLTGLQGKLSPQQLANATFNYMRHGGPGEFTENLGSSVKNNPVPFLLAVVGLSWLMLAQREGSANNSQVGDVSNAVRSGMAKASDAKDKVKGAAGEARSGAHNLKTEVQNRSAQARDFSRTAIHNVSSGTRNASVQAKHFIEENPFAAVAIGIGIGAILGSAFPASRFENEQLGEMRDKLVDNVTEAGTEQAEKLSAMAREKAGEPASDRAIDADGKPTNATDTPPTPSHVG